MAKHDMQCPNCGRFVEADAQGFYDREWPYHEFAQVVTYCNESCCDEKRQKDIDEHGGPVTCAAS